MRTLWIAMLCLCACKRHHEAVPVAHDAAVIVQSFADGMQAICTNKPGVTNPDAVALAKAIADAPPAKKIEKLRAGVGKANLGACPVLEKLQAAPAANAPTVVGLGLVELAPNAVSITATDAGIAIAGKPVDRAKLDAALTDLTATKSPLTRVQLTIAPTQTAQTLLQLVDAIGKAGYKDLALVVNADGASRAIPFVLGDVAAKRGVRPIVAIGPAVFKLYSGDGSEGTADKPKATPASAAELGAALTEVAIRRWNGNRTDDDRWLYVTIDPATPIQRVADALAVVRATKDGELFPKIAITH